MDVFPIPLTALNLEKILAMQLKGSSIDGARVIWICDGRMYRLVSQPYQGLVHDEMILEPLDQKSTFPSTKAIISPLSSKQKVETRLFFKPVT